MQLRRWHTTTNRINGHGFAPFYTTLFHILREQIVLAFIVLELLDFGASLSFCNGAYWNKTMCKNIVIRAGLPWRRNFFPHTHPHTNTHGDPHRPTHCRPALESLEGICLVCLRDKLTVCKWQSHSRKSAVPCARVYIEHWQFRVGCFLADNYDNNSSGLSWIGHRLARGAVRVTGTGCMRTVSRI